MDQDGNQRDADAATLQLGTLETGDAADELLGDEGMTGAAGIAPARALPSAATQPPQRQGATLTKAELADMLFEQVGLNKREAKDMVETFFDEIGAALIRGESVKLSGFGNFVLRDKPQRPGRNPKTGEAIPISARRVVTFHASQKLKSQIDAVGSSASASRGRLAAGSTTDDTDEPSEEGQ
jgi:integration host factor subunit alpha